MNSLSTFSLQAKLFANISKDNRLQLWDTGTRQERRTYVEKQHLAHSYICFAWKQHTKDDLGTFVVGTSDCMIIVWDLTRGVVSKTIILTSNTPPNSIAFSSCGSSLFVNSIGAEIIEYDLKTGSQISEHSSGKKGPLKLYMNPLGQVLAAASSSVRLLDTKSGKKRKLNASFPGGITCLSFSQCGIYLACAGNSREILIFHVQDGETLNKDPVLTLTINGICTSIECRTIALMGKTYLDLITTYEDLTVSISRCSISDNTVEKCQISGCGPVIAATFSSSNSIILAYGQNSLPTFSKVVFESDDGTLLEEVVMAAVDTNSKSKTSSNSTTSSASVAAGGGKQSSEELGAPVTVLGPHEMGGSKRPLLDVGPVLTLDSSKKARKTDSTDINHVDEVSSRRSVVLAEAELTLEARLEALSANMLQLEKAQESSSLSKANAQGLYSSEEEKPTSDSMVVLIDQALQSGDDSLLEQCLGCEDADVVEATARRLPVGKVLLLLRRLVAKFEKRPSRGILLTRWLAAILRYHTAFLVSIPDLANQLAGLSQMLEQRLSSYARLASLGGRLDLLMSQISSGSSSSNSVSSQGNNGGTSTSQAVKPAQVYIDE